LIGLLLYGRTDGLWQQDEDEVVAILALDEVLSEHGGLVGMLGHKGAP